MFDSGVIFQFDIVDESGVVDLTTVLGVTAVFQKPDKTIIQRATTVVDAAGGVVEYVCTDTDFDQAGKWKTQVIVQFSDSNVKHSDIGSLTVATNLS